ncbi:MAG: GMC family oxidoreductase [Phycisphaerales bacterium]|nr:GMC family oxidoreductase [Phycisphaerales bacterium]
MPDRYDIIIIGTGAGGATLAHELARTGKRILILERGDFLPRERENWDTNEVFARKRYLARETWFDKHDQPFSPYTHYWVGGNTKMYGAALFRMRESDFGEVRHFGGLSPAWPITYDQLEPYYSRAEALYSVHGLRGADPHEPRASSPFPFPPLEPEPRIRELADDLTAIGLRPFPAPLGLRLDPADRAAAPCQLSNFDGYPDPTEVKADSHVAAIKPILTLPNVTLITGARVESLHTDRSGREVADVIAWRGGERLAFRADIVVLACGAINSAAVLLRSANDRHPHGLANSSGQVGRNLMLHQNGCLLAVTENDNPSQFQKHLAISDFYRGEPDSPFPLGLVQLMGKPDPGTIEWLRGDQLPGVPLDDIRRRTIDFFLTAEDLPSPGNRVTLRDDGAIRLTYNPNNTEAYERLQSRLINALSRVERTRNRSAPHILASRLGIAGVSHQNGTARFGDDPATSVLDVNCNAHDVENLYIVDSSFFPSSAAVNPSLTIMANALRIADHLRERLGCDAASALEARNPDSVPTALAAPVPL